VSQLLAKNLTGEVLHFDQPPGLIEPYPSLSTSSTLAQVAVTKE